MLVGALFLSFSVAPTDEIQRIAYQVTPWWHLFARDTLVGHAMALAAGSYVLWVLGRSAGSSVHEWLTMATVLAFPGRSGARP